MINNYLYILMASCLLGLSSYAQKSPEILIKGSVSFQNPEALKKYNKIWLYKGIGQARRLIDSVAVNADGSFELRAKYSKLGLYQLDILKWQTATIWSDKDVRITARGYDTARVKRKNSGFVQVRSQSMSTKLINNATYNRYIAEQEINLLNDESLAARQNFPKDSTWLLYLRRDGLIQRKAEFERQRIKNLIDDNSNDPATLYLITMLPQSDSDYFLAHINKLLQLFPALTEAQQLKAEFMEQRSLANSLKAGSPIPAIAYNDPDGKVVDIKSFQGKYVLIDFWASWCGPCRKAIPEIKQLYNTYKDKGFDVLSISVDTDNAAWRKAMKDEDMPWTQTLSPNKNKTLNDFMIVGIPTLFLIDRQGRIVEKYTGFSAGLKSRLEGMFK